MIHHNVNACCLAALAVIGCGDLQSAQPNVSASGNTVIAACGRAAQGVVTLRNTGNGPLSWSATTDIQGVTLDPSGVVPANSSVDVGVRSIAREPAPTIEGTITFTTNDPVKPMLLVPVRVQTSGPRFSIDQKAFDFGVMPIGIAAPKQTLVVTNSGNQTGMPTVDPGDGFSVEGLVPIDPGKTASIAFTFTASKSAPYMSMPAISADNYCGDPPTITLKGIGSDGVVGVSPGTIDLGLLACGTKPTATKKLTVINASKQPFHAFFLFASTTYPKGKIFEGTPDDFMVAGESQQDIAIDALQGVPQTAPIIQGWFHDTLTVTTDAPKDTPHDVAIAGTPAGGVIVASPGSSWDFGKRQSLTVAKYDFSLDNYGNMPVSFALSTNAPFSVPSALTVTPGQTSTLEVTHTARGKDLGTTSQEVIDWSTTDPICAPLPTKLQVKAYTYDKALTAAPRQWGHSCAVGTSGLVYCWQGTNTPAVVDNLTDVKSVSVGYQFSCASDGMGRVWCWGNGMQGQLGDGLSSDSSTPVQASGISDAVSVALGEFTACALRQNGGVACWGSGTKGELGNGSSNSSAKPTAVSNLSDAIALSSSPHLTCAARATGAVVCWGEDLASEFGGSGITQSNVPVTISGVSGAKQIAVSNGGCALDNSSILTCWGTFWQANNGMVTISKTPVSSAMKPVVKRMTKSTAAPTFCVIANWYGNDSANCWGYDWNGELGKGSGSIGTNGPTSITKDSSSDVFGGNSLMMSIGLDGSLWQWGKPDQTIVAPTKIVGFDP
jgi:alpha-tubulin suppressor-like RCC1 family protein